MHFERERKRVVRIFLCANILVLAIYLYYVLTRIGQYLSIIDDNDIKVGECFFKVYYLEQKGISL
jgi:hypothetical protein